MVATPAQQRPLVLSGKRLYLRRYWAYERRIDNALRQRLAEHEAAPKDLPASPGRVRPARPGERDRLAETRLCPGDPRCFSIVTGGPGTGKTTTVVRLLALLQAPAVEAGQTAAHPPGRADRQGGGAADRVHQSAGPSRLQVADAVREKIPSDVTTVHRLLGSRPGTRHFRHHAGNPLPLDVLVVDEASMIDLEMMANLLDALPPRARLVLLGDKDQLASVEAGAVLGDLCRDAEAGWYSPQTRRGWSRSAVKSCRAAAVAGRRASAIRWPSKW